MGAWLIVEQLLSVRRPPQSQNRMKEKPWVLDVSCKSNLPEADGTCVEMHKDLAFLAQTRVSQVILCQPL